MKKLMLAIALLFAMQAKAQNIQIGISGTEAFDNSSLGVTAITELPFAKHYELDLEDTFSPLESHVSLGGGRANIAKVTGLVWFNSWGVNAGAEDSSYNVTKVTKDADYGFAGINKRAIVGGLPARFSFNYIQQFNNGISPTGLESSHLQGLSIAYTMRFGCLGAVCIRNSEEIITGKVLEQGNPVCDGNFGGPITCPRTSAIGGGFTASVTIEFPRKRGHEYDVF